MWTAGQKTITLEGFNYGTAGSFLWWAIIPANYATDLFAYASHPDAENISATPPNTFFGGFAAQGLGPIPALGDNVSYYYEGDPAPIKDKFPLGYIPGMGFSIQSLGAATGPALGGIWTAEIVVNYPAWWLGNWHEVSGGNSNDDQIIHPGELFDVIVCGSGSGGEYLLRGGVSKSPSPGALPASGDVIGRPRQSSGHWDTFELRGLRAMGLPVCVSPHGNIVATSYQIIPQLWQEHSTLEWAYAYPIKTFKWRYQDCQLSGLAAPDWDLLEPGAYNIRGFAWDEFGYTYNLLGDPRDHPLGLSGHTVHIPEWKAPGAVENAGELVTAPSHVQLIDGANGLDTNAIYISNIVRDINRIHLPEFVTTQLETDSNYEATSLALLGSIAHIVQRAGYPGNPAISSYYSENGTALFNLLAQVYLAHPGFPGDDSDSSDWFYNYGDLSRTNYACAHLTPCNGNYLGWTWVHWNQPEFVKWQFGFYDLADATGGMTEVQIASFPAQTNRPLRSCQIVAQVCDGDTYLIATDGKRGAYFSIDTGTTWQVLSGATMPGEVQDNYEDTSNYILPCLFPIGDEAIGCIQAVRGSYPLEYKFFRTWNKLGEWEGPFDLCTFPDAVAHPALCGAIMSHANTARLIAWNGMPESEGGLLYFSDDYGTTWATA